MAESKPHSTTSPPSERDVHSPHHHHHHKETHGTSDDIDESTPVDEVKGPGIFHRVKEEVEAIVGAILPKKKDENHKKSSSS